MTLSSSTDNFSRLGLSRAVLLLSAIVVSYWLLPFLGGLLFAPTRKIPGPFWARITRWFEFRKLLKGDSHLEYIRLHEKLGPVVRVGPNRYSFRDPADVKIIYALGGNFIKTEYYEPLHADIPDHQNIFTIRDPNKHKERRRKITNLYSMSTMVNYEGAVDRMTSVCMRKMYQFADENRTISLPDFMQYYAFDVIGEITFDKPFKMMENEADNTGMIKGIHFANGYLSHIGLVPDLHRWVIRIQNLLSKAQGANLLYQFTLDQIAANREANAKTGNVSTSDSFLTKLLALHDDKRLELPNIMDSCGSNIGAGSDTTAITLSSALYFLYTNPDKLAKLRGEVEGLASKNLASDPVTWQEAQNMPYLQAVIKESLRMHPAVGTMLPRKVPKGGLELAGTWFPEGTDVGANAWVLHYSKDIYGEDADVFRPERWLELKAEGDLRESMMFAFGGGSRTCLGKNISLLEMTKVIPQIVRNFDISLAGDGKMETYCAWFVYPQFKVKVKRRAKK